MSEAITPFTSKVTVNTLCSPVQNTSESASSGNHIELTSTCVLAAYSDTINSKGYVKVGIKISDNCIDWGEPQEFLTGQYCSAVKLVKLTDTTFVAVYTKSTYGYGYGRFGTVDTSLKTISWGTESSQFGTGGLEYLSTILMTTGRVLIGYKDAGVSNYSIATMMAISGGVISFGTPVTIESATCSSISVDKLTTDLAVVSLNNTSSNVRGWTLSISDTTITPNTGYSFATPAEPTSISVVALSSTAIVVSYLYIDSGNYYIKCIGATIATNTITFGSTATELAMVSTGTCTYLGVKATALSSTKFVVSYRYYSSNSNSLLSRFCSMSGTTITLVEYLGALYGEARKYFLDWSLRRIDDNTFSILFVNSDKRCYYATAVWGDFWNFQYRLLKSGIANGYVEITRLVYTSVSTFSVTGNMPILALNGTLFENIYEFGYRPLYSGENPYLLESNLGKNPIILNPTDKLYVGMYSGAASLIDFNATISGIETVIS